jgi:hypothetical protein
VTHRLLPSACAPIESSWIPQRRVAELDTLLKREGHVQMLDSEAWVWLMLQGMAVAGLVTARKTDDAGRGMRAADG